MKEVKESIKITQELSREMGFISGHASAKRQIIELIAKRAKENLIDPVVVDFAVSLMKQIVPLDYEDAKENHTGEPNAKKTGK